MGKYESVNKKEVPLTRRFVLRRDGDVTGNSGTGIVSIGLMFPSGRCVLEWTTPIKSLCIYDSIAEVEALHGHDGKTTVIWVDK